VVACIRLLLLTGCRTSGIVNARWSDVDSERSSLRLEDSKAGARDVVLNAAAMAVLGAMPRSGEWLIPGRDAHKPLVNLKKPWGRIRDLAGLADVRLHDLRHSHASVGVATGASLHVLGGLGHRQPSTSARYAHLQDDPLRKTSEAIGSRLSAALEGKPDADVVPLRERA
jgi:integrase